MLSAGKISSCIMTEINPAEFWPRPTRQKQILMGLLVTKIYKNRAMKNSLFNYSMLGYISPIAASLPHIYRRNPYPTHIFKPTHQTWLQASSQPRIFQTNLPLFETFVDFYNQILFPLRYFVTNWIFLCQPYNRYIKLHWAQFPMIGNTYNRKFSKIFIKTFCYNNKVTNEVTKRLPKLSNKEIHFTLLI